MVVLVLVLVVDKVELVVVEMPQQEHQLLEPQIPVEAVVRIAPEKTAAQAWSSSRFLTPIRLRSHLE